MKKTNFLVALKTFKMFFLAILLVTISCSRDEQEVKAIPTVESLSQSQNFKSFNNLFIELLSRKKDLVALKRIESRGELTDKETQELFLNLGFENERQFSDFQKKLIEVNTKLAHEFDLIGLNDSSKKDLFIGAIHNLWSKGEIPDKLVEPDDDVVGESGDICTLQYRSCMQSAYGIYIVTVSGCVAGGVGIAMGSAGWAAPVGGAIAGSCVAGATIHYDASVKQCYYSYVQCKRKK